MHILFAEYRELNLGPMIHLAGKKEGKGRKKSPLHTHNYKIVIRTVVSPYLYPKQYFR